MRYSDLEKKYQAYISELTLKVKGFGSAIVGRSRGIKNKYILGFFHSKSTFYVLFVLTEKGLMIISSSPADASVEFSLMKKVCEDKKIGDVHLFGSKDRSLISDDLREFLFRASDKAIDPAWGKWLNYYFF